MTAVDRERPRAGAALLALTAAVGAASLLVPRGDAADVGFLVATGLALVALGLGVRRALPGQRRAWWLVWAGYALWGAGDLAWVVVDVALTPEVTIPSPIDALYLVSYPFLVTGVLLLSRGCAATRGRLLALDAAIVTLTAGALYWTFLIAPAATSAGGLAARLVASAYPVGDLLLLAVAARLLLAWSPAGSSVYRWLCISLIASLVADSVYSMQMLQAGSYGAGWTRYLTDGGWLLGYYAAARALTPLTRSSAASARVDESASPLSRLVVLGICMAGLPVAEVARRMADDQPGPSVLLAATVAVVVLAVVRMNRLVDEVRSRMRELSGQGKRLRSLLEERDVLAEELRHQATHDVLTGLANRRLFVDRLEEALTLARAAERSSAALLLVDLDDFKLVNDTLGHNAGDQLLCIFAARLRGATRDGDLVARLGGDEFAVIAYDLGADEHAALARRLLGACGTVRLGDTPVHVSASVGIAPVHPGTLDSGSLLAQADVAMYAAKRSGKDRWVTYERHLPAGDVTAAVTRAQLVEALERDELAVHYQPLVRLDDGTAVGVEGLIRWHHPVYGLITPDRFLPAAEMSGLIADLDTRALALATDQVACWQRDLDGDRTLALHVNAAPRSLLDPSYRRQALAAHQRLAARGGLVVEITESMLIHEADVLFSAIGELRHRGVRFALDDFGVGQSSLARLKDLPVDILKLDKSFVAGLTSDRSSNALVAAIAMVGHSWSLTTIAEGVETEANARSLHTLGWQIAQGNFCGPPVEPERLPALLSRRTAGQGPRLHSYTAGRAARAAQAHGSAAPHHRREGGVPVAPGAAEG